MTVFICTECGDRCSLVTNQKPYDDRCASDREEGSVWQEVDPTFAETILLGLAEQERRRSA